MRNQNQPVVVEGYPFIGLFAFVTLVFSLLEWSFLAVVFLLLTLFTVYFFRNPDRTIPQDDNIVVAPADGKVVYVGKVREDRFLHEEVYKVSIFMSVFNVHVNRVPVSGTVIDQFYTKGGFINASLDKASTENEQAGMLIEDSRKNKFLVVQIAGLIARRIVTYPITGAVLERGQRYGLIRFGSRVDLYMPANVQLQVSLGDHCVGGETILSRLG